MYFSYSANLYMSVEFYFTLQGIMGRGKVIKAADLSEHSHHSNLLFMGKKQSFPLSSKLYLSYAHATTMRREVFDGKEGNLAEIN